MTHDPSDVVDTFSPAWMAGYVIGRRPHGPSELPAARNRATEIGGAESFDDGYDTGKASAARLPHHAILPPSVPLLSDTLELEFDQRLLIGGTDLGIFTGDPVYLEGRDDDGQLSWTARARVVRSDWNSNRLTVYIEEQFE